MTTYNSYEEAKIAMPEACIVKYKHDGKYRFTGMPTGEGTTLCNGSEFAEPADHCMTVEQFLNDGHKFVNGDIYIYSDGLVETVDSANKSNKLNMGDSSRYILRAAALKKPKRVKVEYVKVEDSIFDLRPEFEAGELYFRWLGNDEEGSGGVWYDKITTESMLLCRYEEGRLLRRIETPIEWW